MEQSDATIQVAVNLPLRKLLNYHAPSTAIPKPGMRVQIPVKSRTYIGLVVASHRSADSNALKLRFITKQLDHEPLLNPAMMKLLGWCADYYMHPPGEVFMAALPTTLRKGVECPPLKVAPLQETSICRPTNKLNDDQQRAVQAMVETRPYLLEGVTGSGKTEVYMEAIAKALRCGRQALLLLPEIGLTPQNMKRLQQRFQCPIAIIHSGRTDKQKLEAWQAARNGTVPLVVGTRSALWTPLCQPGLIVVDEEHDSSFKQQEGFRYSARDVAVMRAKIENVPVLLGSATPSLESLLNSKRNRYVHLQLPKRAGQAKPPIMEIVDLRHCRMRGAIAEPLVQAMRETIQKQKQVLLFLGRRGYSPVLLCHSCGYRKTCSHCDNSMTLHRYPAPAIMRCHRCGRTSTPEKTCPKCDTAMVNAGHGTQRIEETLRSLFPETRILRFDRDRTRRKGELQLLLEQAHSPGPCIMVGTQMVTKGHHLVNLELVGILDVDRALHSHGFRSMEVAAQYIIQVAGRTGRSDTDGRVMLQTHYPGHPFLKMLINHGYPGFAKATLKERSDAQLPPFARMALLQAESKKVGVAHDFLQAAAKLIPAHMGLNHFGPFPAVIEKRAGFIREQIILTASRTGILQQVLRNWLLEIDTIPHSGVLRWFLDVDPLESC